MNRIRDQNDPGQISNIQQLTMPLSSSVFLQVKHEQVPGVHRRPALKQSQYSAMHFDFGHEHPDGFSCKAEVSRTIKMQL